MMPDRSTVFLVDDDAAVRKALLFLLSTADLAAAGFASAGAFLENYAADRPGCIVIDLRMPGMDGLELQQELARRGCLLPVILVTGHGTVKAAIAALKGGAFDFLEKPLRDEVFLDSVRRALDWDRTVRARVAELAELQRRAAELTPREHEIMRLVVAGHPNKVISHLLGISLRTVEIHRGRVMEKMAARTSSDLVRMALALAEEPALPPDGRRPPAG